MKRLRHLLAAALLSLPGAAHAQGEVGVGIFTFLSGPPAAYGMPGRNAAELMIDTINAGGGVAGIKLRPIFVDEAQGGAAVVSEFRRLAGDNSVLVNVAALSSANCLALAPVAEQLKMPMLSWNCDTHQLFLKDQYEYVYRTNSSTIPEFLAYAIYLLEKKPDVRRVAIINPDYAFGHDAGAIFKAALKAFKPDVEIVAELYPKLGTPNFQTEISRIVAARPDVVFSNLWGADLENFVRQALPRGLFTQSQVVLALGETILQRIELPDGVIVGVLGDGWWNSPTAQANPRTRDFVKAYRERYGEFPVFPSFKMANSILALEKVLAEAAKATGGKPTREAFVQAIKGLDIETYTGNLKLREDNDGLVDQIVGVTRKSADHPFPMIADMARYPAAKVTPPPRTEPIAWIGGLGKDFLAQMPKPGSYK
ncbi:MAG TPA: ABC transporter substrate-binding protein [Beijerinckiaceae bacterium]|nr:ABC transporter substrate-binding protein [Beijerinckiaceae bacterium]